MKHKKPHCLGLLGKPDLREFMKSKALPSEEEREKLRRKRKERN